MSATGSAASPARRMREGGIESVILLGGTVRQTELRRAIGRHILQLPIDGKRTILLRWLQQVEAFSSRLRAPTLRVRILLNPDERFELPPILPPDSALNIGVEIDPNATRGTGGLLRDLAADLPDERWLLIANANQAFIGDPAEAAILLAGTGGDMALMPAHDGNGGFLLLTRCECVKGIAPKGFVDLKEQALPAIARKFDVRVVDPRPDLTPTSIRSLRDYLAVLRQLAIADAAPAPAGRPGGAPDDAGAQWSNLFQICEAGATVAPGARIHNSVVLSGAVVEAGAVVARCVVGPGARVPAGDVVRDRFVTPAGEEAGS